jgi:predicted nucleic acid-binding protein
MPHLADTNILLRWVQPHHPQYPMIQAALNALRRRGEAIYITPQNLIEFWNSATRPADRNGFGFTPAQADQEVIRLEGYFRLAPDTSEIYPAWRQLVVAVGVSGAQLHDARLVAVMRVHGLTHILTLNTQDFRRYAGIVAVHPQEVADAP